MDVVDRLFIGGSWVAPGTIDGGIGRENGPEGLHAFLEDKAIVLSGGAPATA